MGWVILNQPTSDASFHNITMSLVPFAENVGTAIGTRARAALVSAAESLGERALRSGKRYASRVIERAKRPRVARNLFNNRSARSFSKMPYGRIGRYKRSYRSRAKKRARFGRKNVGAPVGSGTAKSVVSNNVDNTATASFAALSTSVQFPLCNIQRQDAFNQLNRRKGDIVNVRGIKMCLDLRNLSATIPIIVHVCILAPRSGLTVLSNDFFRGHGDTDKNIDMTNTSPPMSWMETTCNGINTDLYTVLLHKRYFLHYADQTAGVLAGNTMSKQRKLFKKYFKLNRQISYDGANATPEAAPPLLVVWYDEYRRRPTVAATNNLLEYSLYTVTYFRDPK